MWKKHSRPKGRKFALILFNGDYHVAQYEPKADVWVRMDGYAYLHREVLWTELPLPDDATNHLHKISSKTHALVDTQK